MIFLLDAANRRSQQLSDASYTLQRAMFDDTLLGRRPDVPLLCLPMEPDLSDRGRMGGAQAASKLGLHACTEYKDWRVQTVDNLVTPRQSLTNPNLEHHWTTGILQR